MRVGCGRFLKSQWASSCSVCFLRRCKVKTLRQIAKFDVPGPEGKRFDYLTVDDEDHFLLSAHLGPGILYVIDLQSNNVVKAVPGLPGRVVASYFSASFQLRRMWIGSAEVSSSWVTTR